MREHWAIASGATAIVLIAVVGGVAWWLNARQYVATDDATVDTRIVHIGPPMAGTIAGVPVTDNQRVEAGAVLATIAPAPPSSGALATGGDAPAAVAVHAPVAGWVAHLVAAPGSAVLPGQELMAIVPADFWITANFTETQLADMQTGQPATVTIDAFPGHTFDAHVESFQAGAGQAFSVLPPDNASGSFVKTAQRVPVKLLFDSPPKVSPTLGPGMSAYVRVKVR
ncbi:MAG TPA: efflux RND transporter periplasmic adaptor subunit [Bauldia sp.]|nr:efflux RND transporter periplasmic adaptor subunit [Bauldia sp.]